MNKRGGLTDIFVFMIFTFIILLVSGIFIYIGLETGNQLEETLGDKQFGDKNGSEIISNTFADVNSSYGNLYWLSLLIIGGMIMSIFIGSTLVNTRPAFMVAYIFLSAIAIIVSIPMANVYYNLIQVDDLKDIFANFIGANYIMAYLPLWVTIISFIGAIILFSRMGRSDDFS